MHLAEGILPPVQAVAWAAASAPFVVHGARQVVVRVRENPQDKLLLGAAAAFGFALTAIKLPSVTGSSSHPTGTAFGAVLFRPPVMAIICLITLVFQALLLAHGGITTLGANVFSLGVVGPWVAFGTYTLLRKINANWLVAVFFAAVLSDLATYVTTATQLALAQPSTQDGFLGTWVWALGVFAVTQIPLAIVEGIVTVLAFRGVAAVAYSDLVRLRVLPAITGSTKTSEVQA